MTYPDCSTCGHNATGILGGVEHGRCTTFVPYPEGDPRGMAGYCDCPCPQIDPQVRAWLRLPPLELVREQPTGGDATP